MPNFVSIGQTVVEIPRFWIFQDGGRRHLGFLKFQIFNGLNGEEGRTASPSQISSKSLEPRPIYNDFSIFPSQSSAEDIPCPS